MKGQQENPGGQMPWRERLKKMRADGELEHSHEDLPDVPEPTYVQEEKAKIEQMLKEFRTTQEELKQIARLMEEYKDKSDKCDRCGGARPDGCYECELGKEIMVKFKYYAKLGRLADWDKWWADSKNLAA